MFRSIINFFKAIGSFFNSAAAAGLKASEALNNSADAMVKNSEISKTEALERLKKARAKMVIDGGYESEEAMAREHKKLHDEIFK